MASLQSDELVRLRAHICVGGAARARWGRTLGIDEVEVRGPLELSLALDLISPLKT